MNSRNSNQHKFSEAGEQAGRVISEFMSMADDFSRRLEKEFSAGDRGCRATGFESGARSDAYRSGHRSDDSENTSNSTSQTDVDEHYRAKRDSVDREAPDNEWRNAGEYLRELREAAGYTVDEFAKAMNRQGAAGKIKSVEEGRDTFPDDWLDQMSALLKQNDPMEFFVRLRGLYDAEPQTDVEDKGFASNAGADMGSSVVNQRRQKLQNIFSDDQLRELSDSQFEELLSFVEINFQSALQLVTKK